MTFDEIARPAKECTTYKGVDKGGRLGGLKPPRFFGKHYNKGCGHAKVGVVVQKFHLCSF